jgi:outer membrane protein assembly factor BamD
VRQPLTNLCRVGIPILLFVFFISGCSWFGLGGEKREKTPEELMSEGIAEFRDGDYTEAIELFQALKDRYPYSKLVVEAELKLADSQFEKKLFEEARETYKEFERLHPRNKAIPYVIYQQGMCHFLMMNKIDRDQTSTKEALNEFQRLQKRFPKDPFALLAEKRIRKCLRNLAEHEYYVGEFYFKSGHYEAALKRFEYLINHYPDLGQYGKTLAYIAECKERLAEQEADN